MSLWLYGDLVSPTCITKILPAEVKLCILSSVGILKSPFQVTQRASTVRRKHQVIRMMIVQVKLQHGSYTHIRDWRRNFAPEPTRSQYPICGAKIQRECMYQPVLFLYRWVGVHFSTVAYALRGTWSSFSEMNLFKLGIRVLLDALPVYDSM